MPQAEILVSKQKSSLQKIKNAVKWGSGVCPAKDRAFLAALSLNMFACERKELYEFNKLG